MTTRTNDEIKSAVRDFYGQVASASPSGGCAPACCAVPRAEASLQLGYSAEDLAAVPDGANMGLGCGNPQAIAGLREGETVLDLGSGGGFDCFLAAKQVGSSGRVIGVDMTPAMIEKARKNAETLAVTNVDFRLGEIEHLPVEDGTVDAIISNCVVNLAPEKGAVFRDAFRVLKPGGRLAIADVVTIAPLPEKLATEILALTGCVAGASSIEALTEVLRIVGFVNIRILPRPESRAAIAGWMPGSGAEDFVTSATIEAEKPAGARACCGPSCCEPKAAS